MAYTKNTVYIDEDWPDDDAISAMLPHSCDEWVIGGVEEIDLMIADLQKAKKKLMEVQK
jgi:hypothetical protein